MRQQFLAGADVVREALLDQRVIDAWEEPSILDQQTVGSLAAHLSRGAVWVVGHYLDGEPSDQRVDYESAAAYFAAASALLDDRGHAAIRKRGADIAALGPSGVNGQLDQALIALHERLPSEPSDRTLTVFAGKVMRLDDYLYTRIVEQVIHLDDLARSLDIEPWTNPPHAAALVVACGAEVGRLTSGDAAMLRTLFRQPVDGTLPVL